MAGINQKRVQRFLISCGNEHLQYLCVPARLGPMMWELDTSKDGIISLDEWDSAIAIALDKKLEQRAAARNRDKKVAADQRLAEAFDMKGVQHFFIIIEKPSPFKSIQQLRNNILIEYC